jgi:aryl-alcohol dehydrogenase-like predicted oxidoreductase
MRIPSVILGKSGLSVSRLCFGTGPQTSSSPHLTEDLLVKAFNLGVNFWDTGADYGTYPVVRAAAKKLPRDQLVVSTKTYATDAGGVEKDIDASLDELDLEWIDVLHLHCVPFKDSSRIGHGPEAEIFPFEQRLPAITKLIELKKQGKIKAIGLSTHSVKVVETYVAGLEEIDIVFATCNKAGFKIDNGSPDDMHRSLALAHQAHKGVVAIKVLAFGMLRSVLQQSFDFAARRHVHVLNVGMRTEEELHTNVRHLIERAGRMAK